MSSSSSLIASVVGQGTQNGGALVPLLFLFLGSIFKFNLELGREEGTNLEARLHHRLWKLQVIRATNYFILAPSMFVSSSCVWQPQGAAEVAGYGPMNHYIR